MTGPFVKACSLAELEEGRAGNFTVNGRGVLIALSGGKVYAVQNICTHDDGAFGDVPVVQGEIQCPRHGARFDIASGRATQIPAVIDLETFDVKIEDGNVYVAVP